MSGFPTTQVVDDKLGFHQASMNLFTPAELSPEQIERRKRIRAKGRKHYIFYTGVLRVGVPLFLVMTLWRWHDSYRWQVPPRQDLPVVCAAIAFSLAVYLTAGYFYGVTMWKRMGFQDSTRVPGKRNREQVALKRPTPD
jgi:hypothetical protein